MDASRRRSRRFLRRRSGDHAVVAGHAHGGLTVTSAEMTKTFADQVRETEARHVLQTYKRAPIVLVRGQGARVWDTEGKDYLDFTSGVGVASLGHANPGLARVHRRAGLDAGPHVEPVLPSVPGRAVREAGAAVGARPRVLLQQRHRGDGGVPEVRAPLLVHEGRAGSGRGFVALDARLSRPHVRVAVGHGGSALPRAVRAAGRRA